MTDIFKPAPAPPTELGRMRVLSKNAGIRVSPLQLGAMNIGQAWNSVMGSMDKDASYKLLDAFTEFGGNFIDTANNYQDEESEKWIGDWMKARNNRDQMVIATKFTTPYKNYALGPGKAVNHCGNHKRCLFMSVRDSLAKLQTDFIDILYVHWWDWTTSIKELMDSLHILVQQGKVLYLGISDTPAWVVSAANYYAQAHGKTPFAIYQGRWNVLARDFERDIIPMARHFGMALAPWDAMGGGKFQSKKELERRKQNQESLRSLFGEAGQTEEEAKMSAALEEVANEHGSESVTAVALAYVMSKAPNVFPMVGGRKVEHLKANIESLKIKLTDQQIQKLESVKAFDLGFPITFIGEDPHLTGQSSGLLASSAQIDFVRAEKPIGHQ